MSVTLKAGFLALAVAMATAGGAASRATEGQGPRSCVVEAEIRGFRQDLPHSRANLADGKGLTIVAIGSFSTQGSGASSD